MKVRRTEVPEVVVLEPTVFCDARGYFFEAFNASKFADVAACQKSFVQDNQSNSACGVLRGLHYQIGSNAQDKLVRVLHGEIFDVAVDIRPNSPTFGRWIGETLSAENKRQLWVPVGFAHGFLVTSDRAEVLYKVTAPYDPSAERSIRWDDPSIDIKWPTTACQYVLAPKDAAAPYLSSAEPFHA